MIAIALKAMVCQPTRACNGNVLMLIRTAEVIRMKVGNDRV